MIKPIADAAISCHQWFVHPRSERVEDMVSRPIASACVTAGSACHLISSPYARWRTEQSQPGMASLAPDGIAMARGQRTGRFASLPSTLTMPSIATEQKWRAQCAERLEASSYQPWMPCASSFAERTTLPMSPRCERRRRHHGAYRWRRRPEVLVMGSPMRGVPASNCFGVAIQNPVCRGVRDGGGRQGATGGSPAVNRIRRGLAET